MVNGWNCKTDNESRHCKYACNKSFVIKTHDFNHYSHNSSKADKHKFIRPITNKPGFVIRNISDNKQFYSPGTRHDINYNIDLPGKLSVITTKLPIGNRNWKKPKKVAKKVHMTQNSDHFPTISNYYGVLNTDPRPLSIRDQPLEVYRNNNSNWPPDVLSRNTNRPSGGTTYNSIKVNNATHRTNNNVSICNDVGQPWDPGGNTIHNRQGYTQTGCVKTNAKKMKLLKAAVFNARSINSKIPEINVHVRQNDLDLVMIVETWNDPQNPEHCQNLAKLRGNTFDIKQTPRLNVGGGGILVLHRKGLNVRKIKTPKVKTFEMMEILVNNKEKTLRFVIIYRPESSPIHKYAMSEFYDEFTEIMAYYSQSTDAVIFVVTIISMSINRTIQKLRNFST